MLRRMLAQAPPGTQIEGHDTRLRDGPVACRSPLVRPHEVVDHPRPGVNRVRTDGRVPTQQHLEIRAGAVGMVEFWMLGHPFVIARHVVSGGGDEKPAKRTHRFERLLPKQRPGRQCIIQTPVVPTRAQEDWRTEGTN